MLPIYPLPASRLHWIAQIALRVIQNNLTPAERLAFLTLPAMIFQQQILRRALFRLQDHLREGGALGFGVLASCMDHLPKAWAIRLLDLAEQVGQEDLQVLAAVILQQATPFSWLHSGPITRALGLSEPAQQEYRQDAG